VRLFYVISLWILAGIFPLKGQLPPWTVVPTTNSQELVLQKLDSSVNYDGRFSIVGDAIGAFYDQGGVMQCAGYLIIDGVTRTFTIYGNDAVDNGFQNAEFFTLYYWHREKNCVITTPNSFMSNAQYSTGGSDTIYILGAVPAEISFPKKYYCTNNLSALPIPLQINNTTLSNINVTINPPFTGYSPIVGEIQDFVFADTSFEFTFSAIDNTCLKESSLTLTISPHLRNNPSIAITSPSCALPTGTVLLDTSALDNGTPALTLQLLSLSTSQVLTSPDGFFNSINPGAYQLIVTDQELCADTFSVAVQANVIDCSKTSSLITPQSANTNTKTFLPWEGETKIYNSQWQLIHVFNTPSDWDGRDKNGNLVKTGLYFVFTNGKKKFEITVINEFANY
jgi:hypothetical protein